MHKSATKCNETLSKWCKNKHGVSKIMDTFETYHAAAGGSKKPKRSTATVDSDTLAVGHWCHSKFVDKDMRKAAKYGLLKDYAAEVRVAGPEITPTPPAGF
jgi:hypothetical protein